MKFVLPILLVVINIFIPVKQKTSANKTGTTNKLEFKLFSDSFKDGEDIPSKFTCDGINISPSLRWAHPPKDTKSFALIHDDPDAPAGDWVHWIIYNIPPAAREIREDASGKKHLPHGALEGLNDWKRIGYGGPCPPSGTHRYFFKLYALDMSLNAKEGIDEKDLLVAMEGHILGLAELVGKYKRQR